MGTAPEASVESGVMEAAGLSAASLAEAAALRAPEVVGCSGRMSRQSAFRKPHALSGSCDNTLRVWDVSSGACVRTLSGHSAAVFAVSVYADPSSGGMHAVSGSGDKTLRVWDVSSGACVRTLSGHSDIVRAVSVYEGR